MRLLHYDSPDPSGTKHRLTVGSYSNVTINFKFNIFPTWSISQLGSILPNSFHFSNIEIFKFSEHYNLWTLPPHSNTRFPLWESSTSRQGAISCGARRRNRKTNHILRLISSSAFTMPSVAKVSTILSIRPNNLMGSSPWCIFRALNIINIFGLTLHLTTRLWVEPLVGTASCLTGQVAHKRFSKRSCLANARSKARQRKSCNSDRFLCLTFSKPGLHRALELSNDTGRSLVRAEANPF